MKRLLIRSPSFVRAAKRFVKKRPGCGGELGNALTLLENDVFHPSLKAHNSVLKESLSGRLFKNSKCKEQEKFKVAAYLDIRKSLNFL